jgi:hypothetical protein
LVIIEHFSKWLELVPLLDCSREGAAYAFLDKVLSRFGARTKILTNQIIEFHGEFQKLCEKALINHRMTSRDHPKENRLVEWMVQIVRWGYESMVFKDFRIQDWDLQLPWLAMGYRFSRQASLSYFSPYFLLFDYEPELPVSIRRNAMAIINMDDPNVWI